MGTTSYCKHAEVETGALPTFQTNEVGIPLILNNSVEGTVCKKCGAVLSHAIKYPDRLIAAAAVARVLEPEKLTGSEIKFLRKALKEPARVLADLLQVAPETISRWENDERPMNPQSEKLLRIYVGLTLGQHAPAVDFNPEQVLALDIRPSLGRSLVMSFRLVDFKVPGQAIEPYFAQQKEAA